MPGRARVPDAEEVPLGAVLEVLPRTMLFAIFECGSGFVMLGEVVLEGSHEFIQLVKEPEASGA